MASNNPPSPNSNKRKRGQNEADAGRAMKNAATNGDSAADAMYVSLLQGIVENPTSTQDETSRTAQAALQQQQSSYPEPNVFDHAAAQTGFDDSPGHMPQPIPQHQIQPGGQGIFDARQSTQAKPAVGSQAWHQLRKDNHKEGEFRKCSTF